MLYMQDVNDQVAWQRVRLFFLVSEGKENGHFPPWQASKTSFVFSPPRQPDPWDNSQNYLCY